MSFREQLWVWMDTHFQLLLCSQSEITQVSHGRLIIADIDASALNSRSFSGESWQTDNNKWLLHTLSVSCYQDRNRKYTLSKMPCCNKTTVPYDQSLATQGIERWVEAHVLCNKQVQLVFNMLHTWPWKLSILVAQTTQSGLNIYIVIIFPIAPVVEKWHTSLLHK